MEQDRGHFRIKERSKNIRNKYDEGEKYEHHFNIHEFLAKTGQNSVYLNKREEFGITQDIYNSDAVPKQQKRLLSERHRDCGSKLGKRGKNRRTRIRNGKTNTASTNPQRKNCPTKVQMELMRKARKLMSEAK
ncbi:hypothetical protein CHS0354_036080 [Potamilus streckersoni]|uniref:Uncharacterized protein n=1 Tax=Potamilus streckersoni TaxID=2493646 RepID=A0AAE0VL84_9BIVA|nr:hypothetical protein CHS0354_036080 [Potamilus streckersoni]